MLRHQYAHVLIVVSMASVCSCALINIGMSLLYMWIWPSLCLWMPWPHEVPCHPWWQCWSPNLISVNGFSTLMCSGKHWNVSSIHVNLILTVLVDAVAPWGAMPSMVTMLISLLDWYISSIHVNLILTVLVDALAPWGVMSSTVTMLIT